MTAAATAISMLTPDDAPGLPEAEHAELIDGRLVDKPSMSADSSAVWTNLVVPLGALVKDRRLGLVLGEQASYACFPHRPRGFRRPDLSVIRRDRLTPEMRRGHIKVRPDLVAETRLREDGTLEGEDVLPGFAAPLAPLFAVPDELGPPPEDPGDV